MKTTSKLLAMLLLVAMCLSLMGGSAYALEILPEENQNTISAIEPVGDANDVIGSNDLAPVGGEVFDEEIVEISGGLDKLDDAEALTAEELKWSVGSKMFETLNDAVAYAKSGATVTLTQDASIEEFTEVAKKLTIDLDGYTLSLNDELSISASVTIKNGTVIHNGNYTNIMNSGKLSVYDIAAPSALFNVMGSGSATIYSGTFKNDPSEFLADGYEWNSETGVVGKYDSVYVAYVNDKGYETADEAFAAAAGMSGKVTITFPNDPSVSGDIAFSDVTISGPSSLVINMNNNCLAGNIAFEKVNTTINGYKLQGYVSGINSSITLGSNTNVEGTVGISEGGSLKISGGTVDNVNLAYGTLSMSKGTIGWLNVDNSNGTCKLSVSGGSVESMDVTGSSAVRAITGGEWNVDDEDLQYFDAAIADGYVRKGDSSPYTVAKKGSSSDGGSGSGESGNDGDFSYTVYGSPYTKNSDETLYIDISDLSENGYWIGTNSNASNAKKLSEFDYEINSYSNGYELVLSNSYLDKLASGTYYGFVVYNGETTRMGSFVVKGSNGGTVNPGDVAVWPVDENEWYSGDPMLAFNYRPAINDAGIEVDGWTVPGVDYVNNWMGTLKLGTSYLSNLSRGWHTLTINTDEGRASCDFYIGATLKPVDTDKHVTGSSKNLKFVCTDPISRVWVGGRELDNSDYEEYFTLSSSRKTITLTAKFLNNRTAGETYTLTVMTDNGDTPSCTFQILTRAQASSSPRTGDESNLALWAALLIVSGGAAIAVLPRVRKHEN